MDFCKSAGGGIALKDIRINAIQPGFINTAMTAAMPQHAIDSKLAEIPLGRPGEPEEVASVVLFLASPATSPARSPRFPADATSDLRSDLVSIRPSPR